MKNVYKDIEGYEGLYKINKDGKVWSCKGKGRILKTWIGTKGYVRVELTKNKKRKSFMFHRLLALNFIPNPENKPQVNHKNGIKDDNRLENLEWNTQSENMKHAFATGLNKITDKQRKACAEMGKVKGRKTNPNPVFQICSETNKIIGEFESQLAAANYIGVHYSVISKALINNWKSGGYKWRRKLDI